MSEIPQNFFSRSRKIITDSILKQVRHPKTLLFSLFLVVLFAISVFIVKPDLVLTFEDVEAEEIEGDEDSAEKFGKFTMALLLFSVLPLIIWIYFRQLIQYLLNKTLLHIQGDISDIEQSKIMAKKELSVSAIKNGTVIDHIPADHLFKVISILGLDQS